MVLALLAIILIVLGSPAMTCRKMAGHAEEGRAWQQDRRAYDQHGVVKGRARRGRRACRIGPLDQQRSMQKGANQHATPVHTAEGADEGYPPFLK